MQNNGNHNTANFVFKFCVEEGPDTTPPLIVTTNLLNNMPIAHNQTETDLDVYTNEPADCRWSRLDQSYKEMENNMTCVSRITEWNAQMLSSDIATLIAVRYIEIPVYSLSFKEFLLFRDRKRKSVDEKLSIYL